ncbi:MAG: SGNH/GDSL hydrolase family protein [Candidatus Tritonobacter lacicola]|nr:SGNH/GDSL hydrolase family protein [Candidatus Tritonobacter lacicola]
MRLLKSALVRKLGAAAIALVVTFLAIELILRATHLFGARLSWTMPDPLISWRMVPGAAYWYYEENDHPITGRINRHGWRDRERQPEKPEDARRVAVLGDSFVEAMQVEQEKTFLSLAEERLGGEFPFGVEVMNFGRSGATTTEELLILENDVLDFSPDMVVLFFMPRTDIEDVSRETAPETLRPFYTAGEEGELRLDPGFRETGAYRLKGFVSALTRNSALASLLVERRRKRLMENVAKRYEEEEESLGGFLTLCTASPDEAYAANYALNKRLIGEMARLCGERGCGFLLVCMETLAYEPESEERYRSIDPSFDGDFFDKDLGDLAAVLGVDYIGLQGVFRDDFLERGKALRWIHWNYDGHGVVADALAGKLGTLLK